MNPPGSAPSLTDTFGRLHDNLRISVTDRCNIRCFYCMPEEASAYAPRQEILSFEEIAEVVAAAVAMGVRKLRLTGGEPLLRRDLPRLIEQLLAIAGVEDLALTTNAVLLADHAEALYAAGLRRLNIHLDTLDAARFHQITRRNDFAKVMAGIDRAQELGFGQLKLNAVAVKNLIEPDILPLARFGRERNIEIRFIEFMPLDAQDLWDLSKVLTQDAIMAQLTQEFGPLDPVPDADPRAPATEFRYRDTGQRLGFVSSVSRPFCANCNRLRLTADGKLRYCLFAIEEMDVRNLLRGGLPPAERQFALQQAISANIRAKWAGHAINTQKFVAPPRPMHSIGG